MPDPVTSGRQESQRRVLTVVWRGVGSAILHNGHTHTHVVFISRPLFNTCMRSNELLFFLFYYSTKCLKSLNSLCTESRVRDIKVVAAGVVHSLLVSVVKWHDTGLSTCSDPRSPARETRNPERKPSRTSEFTSCSSRQHRTGTSQQKVAHKPGGKPGAFRSAVPPPPPWSASSCLATETNESKQ